MNTLTSTTHGSALAVTFRRLSSNAANTIEKLAHTMVLRHQHKQTVAALNMLSDHELEDIGLIRANIKEAVKSSLR
ncbi:MAG: DUF1127 domain-containing protein [Sneathiella sp.]